MYLYHLVGKVLSNQKGEKGGRQTSHQKAYSSRNRFIWNQFLTYLSPGDPAEIMLTECGNIPTPELLAQTRAELGLDKPFFGHTAHG